MGKFKKEYKRLKKLNRLKLMYPQLSGKWKDDKDYFKKLHTKQIEHELNFRKLSIFGEPENKEFFTFKVTTTEMKTEKDDYLSSTVLMDEIFKSNN